MKVLGPDQYEAVHAQKHHSNHAVTIPFIGGRKPGKININTIWDVPTFRALCDAQPCNGFYGPNIAAGSAPDQIVDNIFHRIQERDPILTPSSAANFVRPFGGFGLGYDAGSYQWPDGIGINNTLFATNDPVKTGMDLPRLFEVPNQSHPYRKYELLTKIANNVTVRSNVFAVWCTVGFFEVDENGRLGAEIGRIDGRQQRHRFFAIIDRSVLDPWIRLMNLLISQQSSAQCAYDVAAGWKMTGTEPPPQPPPAIPLLAVPRWNPRYDYSVLRLPSGPGVLPNLWPTGPPAIVLYSTVIE
jgi:hypothetical protein